jgi:hypothetical protein
MKRTYELKDFSGQTVSLYCNGKLVARINQSSIDTAVRLHQEGKL